MPQSWIMPQKSALYSTTSPPLFPISVDCVHDNIARPVLPVTTGLVAEAKNFASLGVEFRVSSKGRGPDLALKIIPDNCLQRHGIHGVWRPVFLGGQEHPSPKGDADVCCCSDHPFDRFGVFKRVSVSSEQALPHRCLCKEPVRPDITLLVVDVPTLDAMAVMLPPPLE